MFTVPITIADNFFDNPWTVREWALSLKYTPDAPGRWPGERTECLSVICPPFFKLVVEKVMLKFISHTRLTTNNAAFYSANMVFQKIKPSDYNNRGWIHSDLPAQVTSMVYLTPGINSDSGTSFYHLRSNRLFFNTDFVITKAEGYSNKEPELNFFNEQLENNNNQFIETCKTAALFNRCVTFDSSLFHGANNFLTDDRELERLTLITFFDEFYVGESPLSRVQRHTIK